MEEITLKGDEVQTAELVKATAEDPAAGLPPLDPTKIPDLTDAAIDAVALHWGRNSDETGKAIVRALRELNARR